MEEARELQLTARRCTTPCSDPRMSRAFAKFKRRILENVVRAGISKEEALERMHESGEFKGPMCAMTARAFGGACLAYEPSLPSLRERYKEKLWHFESGSAAILEANNIIGLAASEAFGARLHQEGAIFGIESPNNLYQGPCLFPIYAHRMRAFLENKHYDIGVAVLTGAISHAVMAKALGLEVVYVRAKRHGARIEFEPMCGLERIRGKRMLIIEDDMSTGRTIGKVVSELRRFGPAGIEIGLFSNTNPRVGEAFLGCRIAYNQHKVALGEKGTHYDEETERVAIVRLLNGLRQ